MSENSAIEWTDHTFNPWHGCSKVSPGCVNCYAETLTKCWDGDFWGKSAPRRFFGDKHWDGPLRWNRRAEREGVRQRVFCGSMCDVFEDREDLLGHRDRLIGTILETPWLDWLLLTKRPENILPLSYRVAVEGWDNPEEWPENVWLGTSVEDQRRADERIPTLLDVPAAVRFLSCEPLLGPVSLHSWVFDYNNCPHCGSDTCMYAHLPGPLKCGTTGKVVPERVDWVIVGGESGHNHRPMHPDWARSLRDQCLSASVPFFFKQWGGRTAKAGGRVLDGRIWDEIPESVATTGVLF